MDGEFELPAPSDTHRHSKSQTTKDGAPEKIRTSDLQLRRLPLYPAELRAHVSHQGVARFEIPQSPHLRESIQGVIAAARPSQDGKEVPKLEQLYQRSSNHDAFEKNAVGAMAEPQRSWMSCRVAARARGHRGRLEESPVEPVRESNSFLGARQSCVGSRPQPRRFRVTSNAETVESAHGSPSRAFSKFSDVLKSLLVKDLALRLHPGLAEGVVESCPPPGTFLGPSNCERTARFCFATALR